MNDMQDELCVMQDVICMRHSVNKVTSEKAATEDFLCRRFDPRLLVLLGFVRTCFVRVGVLT